MHSLYTEQELTKCINEIKRTKKGYSILRSLANITSSPRMIDAQVQYFAHSKYFDSSYVGIRFGTLQGGLNGSLCVWSTGLLLKPFGIQGLVLLIDPGYYMAHGVKAIPPSNLIEKPMREKYETFKLSESITKAIKSNIIPSNFGYPNNHCSPNFIGFLKLKEGWVHVGVLDHMGGMLLGLQEARYSGSTPAAVIQASSGGNLWIRGFLEHSTLLSELAPFCPDSCPIAVEVHEESGDEYNAAGAKFLVDQYRSYVGSYDPQEL